MKNLAIIPARSGSKGIKDKNIKELCGKPLMAYTIEAAKDSGCFDEVMVSTDSKKYAQIAEGYGANVPFLRSGATATDTASSWDMVEEVLGQYRILGKEFDTFCLLQPTSPLRTGTDIAAAYALYREKASFAVVSVCEAEHSPLWCGHLPNNHELIGFLGPENMKRRQEGSFAYIMNRDKSVDIDAIVDFRLAEIILVGEGYSYLKFYFGTGNLFPYNIQKRAAQGRCA